MDSFSDLFVGWSSSFVPQVGVDLQLPGRQPTDRPLPSALGRVEVTDLLDQLGTREARDCADALRAGTRFSYDASHAQNSGRCVDAIRHQRNQSGMTKADRRHTIRTLRRLGERSVGVVVVGSVPPNSHPAHAPCYVVLVAAGLDRAVACYMTTERDLLRRCGELDGEPRDFS